MVPCDNQVAGTRRQQSHVIFSDDLGSTWKLGGAVGPQCDECQVVELADGALMLNIRSYRGNNRRLVSLSKDGGETWSPPMEDEALIEPVCQASIMRHPGDRGGLPLACRGVGKDTAGQADSLDGHCKNVGMRGSAVNVGPPRRLRLAGVKKRPCYCAVTVSSIPRPSEASPSVAARICGPACSAAHACTCLIRASPAGSFSQRF